MENTASDVAHRTLWKSKLLVKTASLFARHFCLVCYTRMTLKLPGRPSARLYVFSKD
jgi:hypothetical protein